jgi:arylsulfatase
MVGDKTGAPISKDFKVSRNEFTGKVNWVNIDAGEDSQDHLIDPEEWVRIHMSIQ